MKNDYCKINKLKMGQCIKEARTKMDLTQEELGNMLGISMVAISRYENGWASPCLKTLVGIAEITQTPIERFFDIPANKKKLDEYNDALCKINDLCMGFPLKDLKLIIRLLQRMGDVNE